MKFLHIVSFCVIVGAFLRLLVRRPRHALIGGLVFTGVGLPALPVYYLPIDKAGVASLFLMLLTTLAFQLSRRDLWKTEIVNRYNVAFTCFTLMLVVYLPLSPSVSYGTWKSFVLFSKSLLPLVVLSSFAPFSKRDIQVIFATLIAISCLTALSVFALGDLSGRATISGALNPITASRAIGLGAVAALARLSSSRLRSGFLSNSALFLAFFFAVAGMIAAGSRGPLIATVVSLPGSVLLLPVERRKKIASLIWLVLLLSGSWLVLSVLPEVVRSIEELGGFQRLVYTLEEAGANNSDQERLAFFGTAWEAFVRSNGLGIGTGGFLAYSWYADATRWYPHNLILEVAAEWGLIGLTMLGYIMALVIRRLGLPTESTVAISQRQLFAALWCYALVNAMVTGDVSMNNALWIFGGMCWCLSVDTSTNQPSMTASRHNASPVR